MKIINAKEMRDMIEGHPEGGIVFADYRPDVIDELLVTDGDFGATCVIPYHGEVFDFDWNVMEYRDDELFMVFDNNDVLQMIQTLTRGLRIKICEE